MRAGEVADLIVVAVVGRGAADGVAGGAGAGGVAAEVAGGAVVAAVVGGGVGVVGVGGGVGVVGRRGIGVVGWSWVALAHEEALLRGCKCDSEKIRLRVGVVGEAAAAAGVVGVRTAGAVANAWLVWRGVPVVGQAAVEELAATI